MIILDKENPADNADFRIAICENLHYLRDNLLDLKTNKLHINLLQDKLS